MVDQNIVDILREVIRMCCGKRTQVTRIDDFSDVGTEMFAHLSKEDLLQLEGAVASAFIRGRKPKVIAAKGMDYKIRKATGSDLVEILELLNRMGLPTAGVDNNISNFLVSTSRSNGLLAVIGMEIAGANGLLRSLACDPNFCKQGIAAELVAGALTAAREQGIKNLYLMTQSAEKYMRKFGFKTVERQDIPEDLLKQSELNSACPTCSTCMSLGLV